MRVGLTPPDHRPARLAHHPAAQGNDEPGLLGEGDELVGVHQSPGGVVPANQRFERHDVEGAQRDYGLVAQLELTLL